MTVAIEELLSPEGIAVLGESWGLSAPLEFVQKTANYVYRSQANGKPLIIKLTAPFRRRFEAILAEMEWVDYLHGEGVEVAAPIRTRDGRLAVELEGKREPLTAVAIAFAEGHLPVREELTVGFLQKMGRILGRLHNASSGYALSEDQSARHNWRGQVWPTVDRYDKLGLEPEAREQLLALVDEIAKLPKSRETYGMAYGDFHPANLHITDEGKITFFDFDACCYHWFLYDLATIILHGHEYFDRMGVRISQEALSDHLVAGYRQERAIDLAPLPLFLRLRAKTFICWARVQLATRELDPAGRQWIERVLQCMEVYPTVDAHGGVKYPTDRP